MTLNPAITIQLNPDASFILTRSKINFERGMKGCKVNNKKNGSEVDG